jgi:hypothetical protein
VPPQRLQQANALQGVSRNVVGVLGPALGGAIVVAGSPGLALAVDAASFFVCAALLARIRVPRRAGAGAGFLRELREGWGEFTARSWLWSSVLLFGLGNLAFTVWPVLGPLVANAELGGAGAWGTILALGGIGSLLGGVLAMRVRPRRPLVASVVVTFGIPLQCVALAVSTSVWVIAATSFVAAVGLALHLALWFTVFQQQVPERAQSRVSSYDALGSFVFMPLGYAVAGPLADAVGIDATLWAAAAVNLACLVGILLVPSIWSIRREPAIA